MKYKDYIVEGKNNDEINKYMHDTPEDAKNTSRSFGIKPPGSFKYTGPMKVRDGWLPGKNWAAFAKFLNSSR